MVKDSELQVRTVCEYLYSSESIEMYQWILRTIFVVEPDFDNEDVCLIFTDQLVTNTLLTNLNIDSTCTLHGDQWHLLHYCVSS